MQTLLDPVIQKLERDLPNYLAGSRWYRAKAQTIASLSIQDILNADGFLVLLIRVSYLQGVEDLYLLPIASVSKPTAQQSAEEPITTFESPEGERVDVYDAVQSHFFRRILLRAFKAGTTFKGKSGSLTARSLAGNIEIDEDIPSSVSKAEQSNTSIIYDGKFILKLFRKVEPGINPDVEIGAYLTRQGFKNTPAVLGTLEYHGQDDEPYSAGILQQFVPNRGDAWKYTLESLAKFYPDALKSTVADPELLGDYAASAKLLGTRTAQMHAALSGANSDPDFTPESFTASDAQKLSEEIATQARQSMELLRGKSASLPFTEQQLAVRVIGLEPRIVQQISNISSLATDAKRIRHHGDYHLGQVLYSGSDFMIIDFEGEPARPLSQRRTKALSLRDVAGMLRSFQYAAYAGLYGLVPGVPTDPESAEKIDSSSAFWNSQVSKLFLEAYFMEADGQPFLPSAPEQRRQFLDAFLLQKALYEVEYELNNRPAWVGIPLRGILSLLQI